MTLLRNLFLIFVLCCGVTAATSPDPHTLTVYVGDCVSASKSTVSSYEYFNKLLAEIQRKKRELKQNTWTHHGGKTLNHDEFRELVIAIIRQMPNVRVTKDLVDLIVETAIVETRLGGSTYKYAAQRGNYGLMQFCKGPAKDVLARLEKESQATYDLIMNKWYKKELSLEQNLLTNVPFSVALSVQYYLQRGNNLHKNITTVHQRARMWKRFYNSPAGAGTPEKYVAQVQNFYKAM